MNQAGKAIAGLAPNAFAVRHVLFIKHDSARGREGVKTGGLEVLKQLLDAWLAGHRRIGVWSARRRLGWVDATRTVHLVHLLGLHIIRFHVVVADRPGRRDPVVFAEFPEVLTAQPVEGSAVHLGGAANEVMDLWLEWSPAAIVPSVCRDISVVDEYGLGIPVEGLTLQPVAAFYYQDTFPSRGQLTCQGTSAGSAPNDDHVVVACHGCPSSQT